MYMKSQERRKALSDQGSDSHLYNKYRHSSRHGTKLCSVKNIKCSERSLPFARHCSKRKWRLRCLYMVRTGSSTNTGKLSLVWNHLPVSGRAQLHANQTGRSEHLSGRLNTGKYYCKERCAQFSFKKLMLCFFPSSLGSYGYQYQVIYQASYELRVCCILLLDIELDSQQVLYRRCGYIAVEGGLACERTVVKYNERSRCTYHINIADLNAVQSLSQKDLTVSIGTFATSFENM